MFGYIKPCQPQLRVCELQAYKAVYCGLCIQLGRSFGLLARFTLSYDATFLALLAMGVGEEEPDIQPGRCAFNPLRRIPVCRPNDSLAFAADVSTLTLCHKLRDDRRDKGFWGRLGAAVLLWVFGHTWKSAARRQPELGLLFTQQMARQRQLEEEQTPDIDRAGDPTAQMLAGTLAALDPRQHRVLERLGYLVGRYVYLADALDDLEQDRKTRSYNPLLLGGREDPRQVGRASLNLTMGEAAVTYQLLEVGRFGPILENIFTLGLHETADALGLPQNQGKTPRGQAENQPATGGGMERNDDRSL